MGKAEAGSAKAIGNAIKAKGLGRLRWYCQVCEKQCRDENGFQAHCRSEPHMRKIMNIGPKAGSAIADFSRQFQSDFMTLLRSRHLTNRVQANKVYNEYIQDKHHTHMNATRWVTLNGFIMTIGKAGLVKVDEDEKGLWIQWIDNRPETLSKQANSLKFERAQMDGEERERKMLEEQIARAKAAAQKDDQPTIEPGLQREEGEKVKLTLFPSAPSESKTEEGAEPGEQKEGEAAPVKSGFKMFGVSAAAKPNPLKRPAASNVFKSAKSTKTESSNSSSNGAGGPPKYKSEAERLMMEDRAMKASRPQGYRGMGPSRGAR
ncbi:DNA/RNA-binding protein KIN17 [Cryptococcus wingfieldii CBS 7118]|uniref:DNA/RNA-binding protein KIN17 n=1 Tax=Cryptococcus wingfieldii CBS 7118 TaxID=1295528 RepID=A0A1E3JRS5_9TREE|nr:DNA/RNA-binding protein KIN17 [Cryptococcus wingfieldii CBS 7118]ODO03545.1 DNA/RNA-binding protein KIN17 [Cryptococcus wingfieldii CBS 7118]